MKPKTLKQKIAKYWFKKFHRLTFGCPACGGKVKRWSWTKAICQKCGKDYGVKGL